MWSELGQPGGGTGRATGASGHVWSAANRIPSSASASVPLCASRSCVVQCSGDPTPRRVPSQERKSSPFRRCHTICSTTRSARQSQANKQVRLLARPFLQDSTSTAIRVDSQVSLQTDGDFADKLSPPACGPGYCNQG